MTLPPGLHAHTSRPTPTARPHLAPLFPTQHPQASTVIVYAKTAPERGAHGITAFIVEKGMKARRCAAAACLAALALLSSACHQLPKAAQQSLRATHAPADPPMPSHATGL